MIKKILNTKDRVAVCSRSFSKNDLLRNELLSCYKYVSFNETGNQLEGDRLIEFLKGHKKAIIALEKIDENLLSNLPELKVIGKYGVGLDMIDMNAMNAHKIRLGWSGGVNRRSVSELVIAFAIVMLRHIVITNNKLRWNNWEQLIGSELTAKTIGIIGCGHVGKDLVSLLKPFNCNILVHDIIEYSSFNIKNKINAVSLDQLLRNSDIVTLHVPLTEDTRLMLNRDNLSIMKTNSLLINTARGGLIDEKALKKSLINKEIAAAAFDVFSIEPPNDIELLNLPNFLGTPHIGGSSIEAVLKMGRAAIAGLDKNKVPDLELNIY